MHSVAGTDEKAIIDVLAYRTSSQRQQIKQMFKTCFGKVNCHTYMVTSHTCVQSIQACGFVNCQCISFWLSACSGIKMLFEGLGSVFDTQITHMVDVDVGVEAWAVSFGINRPTC